MRLFIVFLFWPVSALSAEGDEGRVPKISLEIADRDSQDPDLTAQEGKAQQAPDPSAQQAPDSAFPESFNPQRDFCEGSSSATNCSRDTVKKACEFFESFDPCVSASSLEGQRACQMEYENKLLDYDNLLNPILNQLARDLLEYAFSDGALSQSEYTEQKLQALQERYCEFS